MIKFGLMLIIGTAQAACPLLDSSDFHKTLKSNNQETVINGIAYSIEKQNLHKAAPQSTLKPQVQVREKNERNREACHYTHHINDKEFGAFILKEKHKQPVFVSTEKVSEYRRWGEERFHQIIPVD